MKFRFGFVMEQFLGHITASKNLSACVAEFPDVEATWIPVELDNPFGRIPLIKRNLSLRLGLQARRLARRAARAQRLEALFFHTQITSLFSTSLMRKVPSIVSLDATPVNFHTIGPAYGPGPNHGSLANRAKHEINRKAFATAQQLVTWNQWAKDSLINDYQIPAEKVHVLDPGIDTSLWVVDDGARDEVGKKPKILFVGGQFERKGGPLLLDVFRRYFSEVAELHLVTQDAIAPEPGVSVYHDLKANDPRLRRLFAEAAMFVMPTEADISPRVIAEAMVVRLPVISTRVAGIPEMVQDGLTGFLLTPGDGEALRQAIETLIANPSLRRSMGERGRAIALDRFDVRTNTKILLELLKSIARPGEIATTGC